MEKAKIFLFKHFEKILILIILVGIILINYFVTFKIGFLNFFYLPIIAAGYFLGKRMGVLTALLCVSIVILFVLISPASFFTSDAAKISVIVSLTAWSSFLILTSAAIGYLYEEKEKKIGDLKAAYVGILEILSKYLESADRYTQGHSVRVSHMAEDIARAMGLPSYDRENIKVAALLHDIGKTEISMDIVQKAASLTASEREVMSSHTEKGARIISLVGGVLEEAVPIVMSHHKYYFETKAHESEEKGEKAPLGAAIIAVADSYDAMITDRPYRAGMPPWKAYEEIEKNSGKQFHPEVVKAFKEVIMTSEKYRFEKTPVA
ncbi:MAG: HD domain-containing protein [Candidatus Aminicenantes bacterium]|nr:MAG: HD domain-containing protein [Candidatus Aminicenantes bacterium]